MLNMKDQQICELKNDLLVKKENQMDKREKEAREEFSKKEKKLRSICILRKTKSGWKKLKS